MANQVSVTQQGSLVVDGVRLTLPQNTFININTVSSNQIEQTVAVNSGSYTSLSMGGCTDVIGVQVWNDNTVVSTSLVHISGSSGDGNDPLGSFLPPGAGIFLWNSQSISSLAVKIVGGYPTGTPTPGSASIQYFAQQS